MKSKTCNKCGETKPISEFHKHSRCLHGVRNTCKKCRNRIQREYQLDNHDSYIEYQRNHYSENKEKYSEYSKEYREINLEKIKDIRKCDYEKNKTSYILRSRQRKEHVLIATPAWADMQKIYDVYGSRKDGEHVDHIVPLRGKNVCGLHVEYNLQIISAEENLKKGNKYG